MVFDITSLAAGDSVELKADKIVNGAREHMGVVHLGFDADRRAWSLEFRSRRFHGRWSYQVQGPVMTGTLVELPSERLVRRVRARRASGTAEHP